MDILAIEDADLNSAEAEALANATRAVASVLQVSTRDTKQIWIYWILYSELIHNGLIPGHGEFWDK